MLATHFGDRYFVDGFWQASETGHQVYVTNKNENPCLYHCVARVFYELNLTSQLETSKIIIS